MHSLHPVDICSSPVLQEVTELTWTQQKQKEKINNKNML